MIIDGIRDFETEKNKYLRPTVKEVIIQTNDQIYGLRIWDPYDEEFVLDYLEERCMRERIPWKCKPE
jgi:hypothetical protein